jgi:lipoprotein-releasing system permease protein
VRLSLYIAHRYLFAKKSRNAINVISSISVAGVTVGTMALIIVLSVFNGLESLVRSIFNTFDPDLKITPVSGKTFIPDSTSLSLLSSINGIACYSLCVEENALLRYGDKQYVATIKGVDENYVQVTGIDSSMWDGEFILRSEQGRPYAIPGIGIANFLGMRINFITPLNIYIPKRTGSADLDPENAFIRNFIFPSGIYQVEQEFDSKYVFLPVDFARELLEYESEVTSLEIKFEEDINESAVQKNVTAIFGKDFIVRNKFEQQEIFYKVMKSERVAIFFILTLILIVASFSIIGSLTMLIIEKKRDIEILRSLGADNTLIRKIFIFEGWLISIFGALAGIVLGLAICWLQQKYGLVRLQSDSLIVNAYPVVMKFRDFILVLSTVLIIGFWAAWYPVRYLTKKYLTRE